MRSLGKVTVKCLVRLINDKRKTTDEYSVIDILNDILQFPINIPLLIIFAISAILMALCGIIRLILATRQMTQGGYVLVK